MAPVAGVIMAGFRANANRSGKFGLRSILKKPVGLGVTSGAGVDEVGSG
jgi:hypothetical protein